MNNIFVIGTYLLIMALRSKYPTLYYNALAYPLTYVLQHHWKLIASECLNLPKHLITKKGRQYKDWHGSKDFVKLANLHKTKDGWINGWSVDGSINKRWLNWGLVYDGKVLKKNCERCPRTAFLLKQLLPHIRVAGFSWMKPKSVIKAHTDSTGLKFNSLAYHLGLSVPDDCALQVRSQRVYEKNGLSFMFDATFLHYAYNMSNKNRYILYIDFNLKDFPTRKTTAS